MQKLLYRRADWSWSSVSVFGFRRRMISIAGAHRSDGKRFVVRTDEKLTAFSSNFCKANHKERGRNPPGPPPRPIDPKPPRTNSAPFKSKMFRIASRYESRRSESTRGSAIGRLAKAEAVLFFLECESAFGLRHWFVVPGAVPAQCRLASRAPARVPALSCCH